MTRSGRGRTAIAVLFVACSGVLATGVLLLVRWRDTRAVHAPPRAADPDQPIAAFVARATIAGVVLEVQLAPLHADAERQQFEARTLRERFELGDGEPWRLVVRFQGALDASALALGPVEVADERGTALRSLELAAASLDPVRSLFAPPSGSLAPGASTQWVLWGRRPDAPARLSGLIGEPLALTPEALRRSELALPLARLDRPGKKGALDASELEHENVDAGDR